MVYLVFIAFSVVFVVVAGVWVAVALVKAISRKPSATDDRDT